MAKDPKRFFPDDHQVQDVIQEGRRRFFARRPRKRSSVWTALLVLIVLGGWIVSGIMGGDEDAVKTARPISELNQAQQPFAVTTRTVRAENIKREIFLQGRTEADKLVTLAAETNGIIAALPTDKGALVQKGQIICRIDVGARRAHLDEARALRNARKIEYDAARDLVKKGHISESQLAASRAAYDGAVAAVKMRRIELGYTEIRAPFDGILDTQPLKIGDFISVGRPCGTVIDKDPLLVVAHIAENQINALAVRSPGRATLATGEQVNGTVRYIAESPDPTTRTFRVELEVPNKDLNLRDGVTAEIYFEAGQVRGTRIPQSALVLNDDGALGAHVVESGNIVRFRPVEIVSSDIETAHVVGLKEQERLIVGGAAFTRDGQKVEAVDEGNVVVNVPPPPANANREAP